MRLRGSLRCLRFQWPPGPRRRPVGRRWRAGRGSPPRGRRRLGPPRLRRTGLTQFLATPTAVAGRGKCAWGRGGRCKARAKAWASSGLTSPRSQGTSLCMATTAGHAWRGSGRTAGHLSHQVASGLHGSLGAVVRRLRHVAKENEKGWEGLSAGIHRGESRL
jgi:hypothetical protein